MSMEDVLKVIDKFIGAVNDTLVKNATFLDSWQELRSLLNNLHQNEKKIDDSLRSITERLAKKEEAPKILVEASFLSKETTDSKEKVEELSSKPQRLIDTEEVIKVEPFIYDESLTDSLADIDMRLQTIPFPTDIETHRESNHSPENVTSTSSSKMQTPRLLNLEETPDKHSKKFQDCILHNDHKFKATNSLQYISNSLHKAPHLINNQNLYNDLAVIEFRDRKNSLFNSLGLLYFLKLLEDKSSSAYLANLNTKLVSRRINFDEYEQGAKLQKVLETSIKELVISKISKQGQEQMVHTLFLEKFTKDPYFKESVTCLIKELLIDVLQTLDTRTYNLLFPEKELSQRKIAGYIRREDIDLSEEMICMIPNVIETDIEIHHLRGKKIEIVQYNQKNSSKSRYSQHFSIICPDAYSPKYYYAMINLTKFSSVSNFIEEIEQPETLRSPTADILELKDLSSPVSTQRERIIFDPSSLVKSAKKYSEKMETRTVELIAKLIKPEKSKPIATISNNSKRYLANETLGLSPTPKTIENIPKTPVSKYIPNEGILSPKRYYVPALTGCDTFSPVQTSVSSPSSKPLLIAKNNFNNFSLAYGNENSIQSPKAYRSHNEYKGSEEKDSAAKKLLSKVSLYSSKERDIISQKRK